MKEGPRRATEGIGSTQRTSDTPKVNNNLNSANGNTTSSTLRKYSSVEAVDEHNSTVKTALFTSRDPEMFHKQEEDAISVNQGHKET